MRFSKQYYKFQSFWVGRKVKYNLDRIGLVVGICDDGGQCDFDGRRSAKPTGVLIIKCCNGASNEDYICSGGCQSVD
jgi:hypothetical protein